MNRTMITVLTFVGLVQVNTDPVMHDHLITMRPEELMDIIKCVSKTRDPIIYRKFEECESQMTPQVISAKLKCNEEVIPSGMKMCNRYSVFYDTPEIPFKMYECIAKSTTKLTPEEKKLMVNFEECVRKLYQDTCSTTEE